MSNYRDRHNPLRYDLGYDPDARVANVGLGLIVAAVLVVAVLAIALGIRHEPAPTNANTASNETAPMAATRLAPLLNPVPGSPMAPVSPAPDKPTSQSAAQR